MCNDSIREGSRPCFRVYLAGSYTHFLQKKEPRKNISIQLDQMLGTKMLEEDKITKQINLRRKREAEQRF